MPQRISGRASSVGLWDPVKNLTDLGKPAEAVDRGVMLQGHLIGVGNLNPEGRTEINKVWSLGHYVRLVKEG